MNATTEVEQARLYLARLLTHYHPRCVPLPDLMGVCSQIDNMTTEIRDLRTDLAGAKEREAALVEALKQQACKCTGRCAVFEHLPADNGICLDRATASLLDVHAPGWRTTP